ncbi:MAG TPA: hypothetical protein VF746_08595 [Longimicrobium sp.]|jgi:hypothetical protein
MGNDNSDHLATRVLASEGVRSLLTENALLKLCEKFGWAAVNGALYSDPATGKSRELDVVAERRWIRKGPDRLLHVYVLVECKSLSGYHLVFPRVEASKLRIQPYIAWLEELEPHRMQFFRELSTELDEKVANELCDKSVDYLLSLVWDNGPLSESDLSPIRARNVATTFRETNTKTDKEMDSSVIWKALSSLNSAISALTTMEIADAVKFSAIFLKLQVSSGTDSATAVKGALDLGVSERSVYHPILVVEAPIWTLEHDQLVPAEHVRLVQQRAARGAIGWIDIVAATYAETFLRNVTTHYRRLLKKAGAFPLRKGQRVTMLSIEFPDLSPEAGARG